MIGYLDTSVVVPLLVPEPTTVACQQFWETADDVVSSQLMYVEAAAALAMATRMGRIEESDLPSRIVELDRLWAELRVIDVDEPLVVAAAGLAIRYGLRGYDAIHCATAAALAEPDFVIASGDRQRLKACVQLGISTCDTNEPV